MGLLQQLTNQTEVQSVERPVLPLMGLGLVQGTTTNNKGTYISIFRLSLGTSSHAIIYIYTHTHTHTLPKKIM